MEKFKNNYAFIDGQNLYLAIQEIGWKIDLRKKIEYKRKEPYKDGTL